MNDTSLWGRHLSRRQLLRLTAAGLVSGAAATAFPGPLWAAGNWTRFEPVQRLLDGRTPRSGGISLELPHVSEDGSAVPLAIGVDSPMHDDDHIAAIHVFASRNPFPEVASFRLSPLAGRAHIATRIRLNETQHVVVLARTNKGEFLLAAREARITVGGCLMRGDTYAADDLMRARVRAPQRLRAGEVGEVLTLINHPMETGLRETPAGETVPRRLIERFAARIDGEPVLEAELNTGIAANPYLRFHVRPARSGTLELEWHEEGGASTREEATLQVA